MRKKITLLIATAAVATTMVVAPAGAAPGTDGFANKCDKRDGRQAEKECCRDENDTRKGTRQCIQNTRGGR